jgi:hypothetical protein
MFRSSTKKLSYWHTLCQQDKPGILEWGILASHEKMFLIALYKGTRKLSKRSGYSLSQGDKYFVLETK